MGCSYHLYASDFRYRRQRRIQGTRVRRDAPGFILLRRNSPWSPGIRPFGARSPVPGFPERSLHSTTAGPCHGSPAKQLCQAIVSMPHILAYVNHLIYISNTAGARMPAYRSGRQIRVRGCRSPWLASASVALAEDARHAEQHQYTSCYHPDCDRFAQDQPPQRHSYHRVDVGIGHGNVDRQ